MDKRLVAWARAVKSRRRPRLPVLWLFTDSDRLADPLAAAARLPRGLCGVVLRHDADPARAALGAALARICRQRRLVLVVAGDPRLAARLQAGVHLRRGEGHAAGRGRLATSSAHGIAELRRARRAGVGLAFLSPAYPTASHPGAPALGAVRWTAIARAGGMPVAALGGIDGRSVTRLGRDVCAGVGAIGALA